MDRVEYRDYTIELGGSRLPDHPYDFEYRIHVHQGTWSSGPYYRRDLALTDAKQVIDSWYGAADA